MVVHLYGRMCDVKGISEEFKPLGIKILEDCAHSFESTLNGYKPGRHSDAAVFSFYATKNITCGEGGAVITNDDSLYQDLIQRILHGMSAGAADRFKTGQYKHWNMDILGIKANLPDILAALLPSQISMASEKLASREKLSKKYDEAFANTGLRILENDVNGTHARHLYPIWVPFGARDAVLKLFAEKQIGVTVNFRPVNEMNYYRDKYDFSVNETPVSSNWGSGVLSLPLYPGLSHSEQHEVIRVIQDDVCKLIEKVDEIG